MSNHSYILEKYKGSNTRYTCPGCNQKNKTFVRYIDNQTGEHLHSSVGKCNREVNCGYHCTPKQYFQDHNIKFNLDSPKDRFITKPTNTIQPESISFIPYDVLHQSRASYDKNNFVQFLVSRFDTKTTTKLIEHYHIGTSKHWQGATVFWQIDISGKIRTGQIMLYNPVTGRRSNRFAFVHKLLKIDNFNLQQCFFGEHLLQDVSKSVAIFESPKTAAIASLYFDDYICLACGGLNGLYIAKCKVLLGRNVILFPDLSKPDAKVNCYEKWCSKSLELSRLLPGPRFIVSDLLERKANESEKKQGLDLADFLLRFDVKEFHHEQPNETEQQITKLVATVKHTSEYPPSQLVFNSTSLNKQNKETCKPENLVHELNELQTFFETTTLPQQPIKLNSCCTIKDVASFIQSHFETIKANINNTTFLPYFERLKELRSIFRDQFEI